MGCDYPFFDDDLDIFHRFLVLGEDANSADTFDISMLSGITSLKLNVDTTASSTTITNMSAAQAAAVTIAGSLTTTPIFGVTGASTVGQLDTLSIAINDGLSTVNTITVANLTAAGVETVNIAATDNFTATVLTGLGALTNLTATGAGNISLTTSTLAINVNTVVNASAATGTVTVNATDATTNGLAITGTTSTKVNTLTGSAQADVITGGAGNDILSGLAGIDAINGGDGNDTITGGTGADTINVGTGTDTIVYGATAQTYVNAVSPTSGTTALTGIDVISGAAAGDIISMYAGATVTAATAVNTALLVLGATSTVDAVAIVKGNYSATTGIFTTSATGTDSLVQWDADGTTNGANSINDIVLVGFAGTLTATANALTLA